MLKLKKMFQNLETRDRLFIWMVLLGIWLDSKTPPVNNLEDACMFALIWFILLIISVGAYGIITLLTMEW